MVEMNIFTIAKIVEKSNCDVCTHDRKKVVQFQNNLAKINEFDMEDFEVCESCLIAGIFLLKPKINRMFKELIDSLLIEQKQNNPEIFAMHLKRQLMLFAHNLSLNHYTFPSS